MRSCRVTVFHSHRSLFALGGMYPFGNTTGRTFDIAAWDVFTFPLGPIQDPLVWVVDVSVRAELVGSYCQPSESLFI